jgi:DNA-binding GntR family transcriptional regulator
MASLPQTGAAAKQDLAREMGASAGTMRKALDLLKAEHLLTRRQGQTMKTG